MTPPFAARLADGRLHLQHGPIDLIVEAEGPFAEVEAAYDQAEARFPDILPSLAEELPLLRAPIGAVSPRGPVAQRMRWACLPFSDQAFVTPMAAVAGAVADELLAAMTRARRLAKAYVNNGGDVAFFLTPGTQIGVGLLADLDTAEPAGRVDLDAGQRGRGLATSGRGGRSFSLGIADAVTVLAETAAQADAAATLIANAVDVDDPAVTRRPAASLDPDSDLGERPAVTALGPLSDAAIDRALAAGFERAAQFQTQGLILGAVLSLRGRRRALGPLQAPGPAVVLPSADRSVPA
ncbi:MAG: UPF0280 family protein [Marivibrio sp.]|uniref:UPF0280 family protein n=1 Tax=Marivibrio sp. TaxID=2039719 RepID=UPI0032EF8916